MRMFDFILDLLLPQKPLARELLAMGPDEFAKRAGLNQENAGKNILSLFDYRSPLVKEAVWMLKYRGNKKIAALLAACLYDELLAFLEEYAPFTNFTEPLLIPIPLSRKRERERGFNQCVLLCDALMRLDTSFLPSSVEEGCRRRGGGVLLRRSVGSSRRGGGVEIIGRPVCALACALRASRQRTGRNFTLSTSALRKVKDTPAQTKMDKRIERLRNLKGCFLADPEAVCGRNIILIDDVATTGATLDEARRALRKAGARKVIAFTIAH